MTKEKIIEKLESLGYIQDKAATLKHQYTTTSRSSLIKNPNNRNSTGWTRGEYVVASYVEEGYSKDDYLKCWRQLVGKYENQYLILEVEKDKWKLYNYEGKELGGEEYIEKLFEKRDVIQKIYYGSPGTGKSFAVKKITSGNKVIRTTFHPDTDYATFVGCYKPSMKDGIIEYSYTPQIFTDAYITAWKSSADVYLVIEEINRGNCAQIFGDLFQLLDRNKIGKSEYSIKADKDLAIYIEQELGVGHEGIKNGELCLPPNLNIIATMNTSDQSLFPMDSAFKRRWDWEYVPIDYSKDIDSGKFTITIGEEEYLWVDFLKKVNEKIYEVTNSEDKQMGNFFIKNSVDAEEFVNKVMFYLWNEVCKEEYRTNRNFFRKKEDEEFKFVDLFNGDGDKKVVLNEFMTYLRVESIKEEHVENEELEENKE